MTALELQQYCRQNTHVLQVNFTCPTCGRNRELSRWYVTRKKFLEQSQHCRHCLPQKPPKNEYVMVACQRCGRRRKVSAYSYKRGRYAKQCQSCKAHLIHHKEEQMEAHLAAVIERIPAGAEPRRAKPANAERKVLCLHYSKCLDLAVVKNWASFTCAHCEAYEQEPMPLGEAETRVNIFAQSGAVGGL